MAVLEGNRAVLPVFDAPGGSGQTTANTCQTAEAKWTNLFTDHVDV